MGRFGTTLNNFMGWTGKVVGNSPPVVRPLTYYWSVLRSDNGYAGPCCIIRRSSDFALLTIGYVNAGGGNYVIDTATALAFVGASDGTIYKLFDNGTWEKHLIASDGIITEPFLIRNGVLNTLNGKPAIFFDGDNTYLLIDGEPIEPYSPTSNFTIINNDGNGPDGGTIGLCLSGRQPGRAAHTPFYVNGRIFNYEGTALSNNAFSIADLTDQTLLSATTGTIVGAADNEFYQNGSLLPDTSPAFPAPDYPYSSLGYRGDEGLLYGNFQHLEMYVRQNKNGADTTAITNRLNTFFSIF